MDVRDFITDMVLGTTDLSVQTVTVSVDDLLVAGALLFAIFLVLVIFIFMLSAKLRRPVADPSVTLVAGLRGKLEKLEMTLNQLKTERARAKEFYKVEFDYLRGELAQLKGVVSGDEVELVEIPAPPPMDLDSDLDLDEIDRVHDSVVADRSDLGLIDDEDKGAGDSSKQDSAYSEYAPSDSQVSKTIDLRAEDVQVISAVEDDGTVGEESTLSKRLEKTRKGFFSRLKEVFSSKDSIDAETIEELEALLISCDLGVKTVSSLMDHVKASVDSKGDISQPELLRTLSEKIEDILSSDVSAESRIIVKKQADGPMVVLVVGVNGVGKTTTVAKLASFWKGEGHSVLMVAADTFRAAAVDQIKDWGDKIGVPVVSGPEGSKPGTVVFDAMKKAKEDSVDVLLIDTAGRLHNKSNLMQELEGVRNAIVRHQESAPHETVLVVDGATGQNALQQAKEFNDAVALTGVIVTKLDGSPKGGIVVAIKEELGLPVRYIGVGESQADLRPFVAKDFADALFDNSGLANGADSNSSGEAELSAHGETRRRKRRDTTWTI